MHKLRNLVSTLLLALLCTAASADSRPEHIPENYPASGTLLEIDHYTGRLNISDRIFHTNNDTAIHSRYRANESIIVLQAGNKVGFDYITEPSGTKRLTTVWQLPDDHTLTNPGFRTPIRVR
ncbi:hypothetical protein BOW53_04295 [Solemya pervernicosa gill symbiont]|uniref:Uncharacterized protein n=2 Tax=Gammaproteobacteria incertae sedis TaxID=118884 RepID=A0A1T2L8I2_9GAMM|nr:hypothetical protein [Candidatus Reidiella endopervernicosa]OOZ41342.1 hypothetical protein BOW53_04295 [Solemya pervernicosa gill symbiont]QKQ27721.1 hypothetical protein HUE57_16585 [Candidatus Reidiella endopervernicosa]